MYQTIRDIMGQEQVRQASTAPVTKNEDQDDESVFSPDEIGQQEQQEQEQNLAKQQGEFPMHEVNAEPTRYPVDHAKALHSFLKNAAGGTGTFVTANKESHEMAKSLAKSGHLQHQGSRLGGAGGGLRHVWSLTPKGMAAIGQQPAQKKPGMGNNNRQGGQVRRPGMMAYGTSEGVKKAWDARGRSGQLTDSNSYVGLKHGAYSVEHPVKYEQEGGKGHGVAHVRIKFNVARDGSISQSVFPGHEAVGKAAGVKVGSYIHPEMKDIASTVKSGGGGLRREGEGIY